MDQDVPIPPAPQLIPLKTVSKRGRKKGVPNKTRVELEKVNRVTLSPNLEMVDILSLPTFKASEFMVKDIKSMIENMNRQIQQRQRIDQIEECIEMKKV